MNADPLAAFDPEGLLWCLSPNTIKVIGASAGGAAAGAITAGFLGVVAVLLSVGKRKA